MNIYQEQILEHYHNPLNQKKIKNPTHKSCGNNSSCGDSLCIDLKIEDDKIKEISFSGEGCAISQATASMLSEEVKNKKIDFVKKLNKNDILKILELELSPARLKCALLSLETLQKTLENETK
ncbi:MAG: iron-sulfur cluster assembly scaffold protein [Candidatus Moranbacteria bacterium]|nr:iron-sulfur cluster assembly scaffold protein [Candidatus Moranbacteria bacterium]